jgi:hypothetical protein
MQLDKFCPWKANLFEIEKEDSKQGELKFVVFPDQGG